MSEISKKRPAESGSEESNDEWVGPKRTEITNEEEELQNDSKVINEKVSQQDKIALIKKKKSIGFEFEFELNWE